MTRAFKINAGAPRFFALPLFLVSDPAIFVSKRVFSPLNRSKEGSEIRRAYGPAKMRRKRRKGAIYEGQ
jgi:hypothetical protein